MALLTGPGVVVLFLPMFFKYETLKYRFDDDGMSMSWGILFRREILLTYRRIQDIHLTRNIIQRWLGLATVSLQTASGSTGAEMNIEGILEADALRDYLYGKMRGARHEASTGGDVAAVDGHGDEHPDEALTLLREIRDSLAKVAARREAPS